MGMNEATDESAYTEEHVSICEREAKLTDSCLVSFKCMSVNRGKISNRKIQPM